ncbi:hypothetical protein [Methanopyrus sp.]
MSDLQRVVDKEGVLCAFIATKDGFTVDSAVSEEVVKDIGEVNTDYPAAISSTILLRVRNIMEELVELEEGLIVSVVGGHSLVLKEVDEDFIVGLLYDSGKITEGLARVLLSQLEEAARRLKEESEIGAGV